jgi:fructose-bisphosphate aldolase class I
MNLKQLRKTAKALVAPGKGILAADESAVSCKKRFDSVGVPCTAATRKAYRELLCTTTSASKYLSGVILFDETFRQKIGAVSFPKYLSKKKIIPGIKVDLGLIDLPGFPGEKVSKGLDNLPERIAEYAKSGALFAKWRSVIAIGKDIPTNECIGANTFVLARYARICQEAGIVPIVEPEILFDGTHDAHQCELVMNRVLEILFNTLQAFRVYFPGVILKTSMVLPGRGSGITINHDDVADRTCRVLYDKVPSDLGGIVFLSGGQESRDAFVNLNRIAQRGPHAWGITFSYSRAIQDPVLKYWANNRKDKAGFQKLFANQLQLVSDAAKGTLNEAHSKNYDFVSHSQDL